MVKIVSLSEAKTNLSQLIDRTAAGEEIIISKNGVPAAQSEPVTCDRERRTPAGALGLKFLGEDFDDPLPDDLQIFFGEKA